MSAPQKSILSAKDVRYDIAGRTIVSGINLSFGTEPITATVGVNGAGKSTLLRALGGITKPAAGKVGINGKSVSSISSKYHTRDLAFVAQDEVPPAEMRVCDFVSLDRLPYQYLPGGNAAEDSSHVNCALVLIGLETVAQRLCGQFSGGQRRCVYLARVIAQGSPAMLLDEPTNRLDMRHQQSVFRLARSSGAYTTTAIHDLDLVMDHLGRVIVVADGGIAADGIPVDVLARDFAAKIFQVESCRLSSPSSHHRLVVDSEPDVIIVN